MKDITNMTPRVMKNRYLRYSWTRSAIPQHSPRYWGEDPWYVCLHFKHSRCLLAIIPQRSDFALSNLTLLKPFVNASTNYLVVLIEIITIFPGTSFLWTNGILHQNVMNLLLSFWVCLRLGYANLYCLHIWLTWWQQLYNMLA